jgi:hypothetical protein
MAPFWNENFIGSNPKKKKSLKRRAHDLKNQARVQGEGPTQGFNFASSESKLVPTNLDHGPLSKVGLSVWKTRNLAIGLLLPEKTLPSLVGSKFLSSESRTK